jgi:uncharacterized membrane protein HdeD (DUF308 family)
LLALNGAVSVLLGIAIILFPAAGVLTIVWLVGLYALLFGAGMLALAFWLRSQRNRPTDLPLEQL